MRRLSGEAPPWTADKVLASHRFTNVYRAADRVSQYLIRHVLYAGSQADDEIFFRAILFKLFNKISTWKHLAERIGTPSWKTFEVERYARVLDEMLARGETVYSAAYIMPSPRFGNPRKHRNHLQLLEHMMRDGASWKVAPEHQQRGLGRRLAQGRVGGDEEGDANLGLDLVAEQVDDLDVEIGRI
jgi:hypothetical protein